MLSAREIVDLQDQRTRAWHVVDEDLLEDETAIGRMAEGGVGDVQGKISWLDSVCKQHRANFDLWHIEDEARAPGATEAEIAAVKRRVDRDQSTQERPGRGA